MGEPLAWNDAFAVGHEGLDAEHRGLIDAINTLCAACDTQRDLQEIESLLSTVKLSVEAHIQSESAILWEISSGASTAASKRPRTPTLVKALTAARLDDHFAEHDRTLAHIEAIVSAGRAAPDQVGVALCGALKAWFIDHAIKYDAHLKTIFQAM